jgi:hypothetical protein
MKDESYKRWDIILKVVVILGAAWTAWTYFDKKETEFHKTFWDAQLKLYLEATDAASKIANLPKKDKVRVDAIEKFSQLFYGPLHVVEDNENVSDAMQRFEACVKKKCRQTELQNLSLELANACTLSLSEDWNHKFKDYRKLVAERR